MSPILEPQPPVRGSPPSPPPATASLQGDALRSLLLVLSATALALGANALSNRPLAISDPQGPGAPPAPQPRRSLDGLAQALQAGKILLLDARHESLLAQGRPLGAQRLTVESFDTQYPHLRRLIEAAPEVVVLCDSEECSTSDLLVKRLRELGHLQVRVFPGGWRAYRQAGYPLERQP